MSLELADVSQSILETKNRLKDQLPDLDGLLADIQSHIDEEVDDIRSCQQRGESVIPELDFDTIVQDGVSQEIVDQIKRRGSVIVRQVIPCQQAMAWNDELSDYITSNGYYEAEVDPSLDQYFSDLKSGRPQIFGIYWSRPQVLCRAASSMALTLSLIHI